MSENRTGTVEAGVPSDVIWRYTAIAAAVSLIVNTVIYFIGSAADWIPDEIPDSTRSFGLVSVIIVSILPVVLAGGLKVILTRNAPQATQLFIMIVVIVALIAVVLPFLLNNIDTSFRLTLVAMHVVTAGSILAITLVGYRR